MAGQQVMERLRKLYASEHINWVEALPQILDRHHDTPADSGFSPYDIILRGKGVGRSLLHTPKGE